MQPLQELNLTGQRFQLGKAVITRGAAAFCEEHNIDTLELMLRHAHGDFGTVGSLDSAELTPEEKLNGPFATSDDLKLNAFSILHSHGMIMSVYPSPDPRESKIWIQTILADDETYTTILLPSEY
jgi:hypothetical protein